MAEFLPGIPSQNINQADALGSVTADSFARQILEFHQGGLSARREMDLTAEKYAIHLDGEGDGQWADLYDGMRIEMPAPMGQIRQSENLLRPITDNAVAYHTTMPFRFVVEAKPDREAKQRAMVDQAIVNHLANQQRWNRAFAEAMQVAMCYGSCPVHAFWRDDITSDPYEPVYTGGSEQGIGQQSLRRGLIDTFVGDPWDTVYNPGAKRNSRHRYTWGRSVPVAVVKAAFPDVKDLTGSTRLPSAARWQRTSRQWSIAGLSRHGSATMRTHRNGEEMIALLCQEIAPGLDPEFPQGRITLVAVQGTATVDRREGTGGGSGRTVILHDGPLPAGRFSSVIVYSANRFDDIHGKPFVGDLDDLQMQLNQGLSARAEYIRRTIKPPLVEQGIVSDTAVYEDDARLEVDPGAQFQPYFLEYKTDVATLNTHIEEARQAMFTLGGYQAASRGEANAGDAAAKVIALAKADDTIHGPTNQRFRETVEEYAGLAHALFREYADIPWLVEVTGAEVAHLVDPWIDRSMASPEDPSIKLVSGSGATVESKQAQLHGLVTSAGADGEPLMTTRQFRAAWPDQSTYPEAEDPAELREQRARVINGRIRKIAGDFEQQMGELGTKPEMLFMMHQALMQEFEPRPDDDPMAHYNALSSITQDEDESPTAKKLAAYRQAIYGQWLVMLGLMPPPFVPFPDPIADMQGTPPEQTGGPAQAPQMGAPNGGAPAGPTRAPAQFEQGAEPGGTSTAESLRPIPGEVAALTQEAGM